MNEAHTHEHGATLVETLVALALGTLIVIMMTQAFVFGTRHLYSARADARVAASAARIVQTVGYEVRRAAAVSVVNSTHATLTRHDGTTLDIIQNGSSIEVDGDAVTGSMVAVTAFDLSKVGSSLHMTFTLSATQGATRTFDGRATFTPY